LKAFVILKAFVTLKIDAKRARVYSSRSIPFLVYSCDFQCVIDGNVVGRNFKTSIRKEDKNSQGLSLGYVAGNDIRRLRRDVDNGDVVYHKFPGRILSQTRRDRLKATMRKCIKILECVA